MLDLAINGIDLGRGRGGNESYLQGLIQGLQHIESVRRVSVLVGSHFHGASSDTKTCYVQIGPYHRLPYLLWDQSLALRRVRYDWFLSTFFLPAIAPRQSGLFIHDLSFLTLPKSFPPSIRIYMRWLVASAARRAARIFVLSSFVRSELLHYYPFVQSERVEVLYPGHDTIYQAEPCAEDEVKRARYNLAPGYILTVSSIHPRKNLSGLLDAYRRLRGRVGTEAPPLVVVGQRYWGNQLLESQDRLQGVQLLGYVPQEDLPSLYRGAGLFVYPSLYEGFGLPPIEAMACGVPTLCGDNSSLPEAVGDAAIMVNMREPEMISAAMQSLLLDHSLQRQMSAKGLNWVKQYNWQRTAEQLMNVLEHDALLP